MAIVRNRSISDSASVAVFEVVNDSGSENVLVVDVSELSGAGETLNQSVSVSRVVASVAPTNMNGTLTLSWGTGVGEIEFLHLGSGSHDINIPFEHTGVDDESDIYVSASADTLFTLRLYVTKKTGYPLSMGSARNRP